MKQVHVECKPDELLVSKLGFKKKLITHHQGKSRVFQKLSRSKSLLAMVDEDPGSAKTSYEKSLKFVEVKHGIKYFSDSEKNKVMVLSGELEVWILNVCHNANIKPAEFGLPAKHHELKAVINNRLDKLGNLIDELIRQKNPAILQLKSWLK
jgi:hypothetical protein